MTAADDVRMSSGSMREHVAQLLFSKHGLMTVELTEIAEF